MKRIITLIVLMISATGISAQEPDKESLRLVKSTAGLWTPGKDQHLEPCSRTLLFPVIWQLPEDEFACIAQTDESRHEISVGYGYITLPQAIDLLGAGAATVLGGLYLGIADLIAPVDLERPKRIDNGGTGGFSFQYLYSLNRTIKLGGTVCYERTWGKWNNGEEYIVHYPAILATSKFMWFNHEHFGMYSKLS